MYCNKPSVNTLTSLLVAHGIRHAVVCPGSRNAPIVHNLNECPDITCYPVTDERSAGFFALGVAQATDEPVVVCVTSGTALLNLAPAVAEAHYQHQSLIVVSADRPAEWIDQLDGQTLRQPGALEPWVKKTVTLPDLTALSPQLSTLHWYCNRLVNEALIEATGDTHPCVHINVPLSEPLFNFTVEQLPDERVIKRFTPAIDYSCLPQQLLDDLLHAERPLIVFGQLSPRRFHYEGVDHLFSHVIVLHEALAPFTSVSPFDEMLSDKSLVLSDSTSTAEQKSFNTQHSTLNIYPDFILHVGDAIVSKRLKHFLREAKDARTWRISLTDEVEDTFQNLRGIVTGDPEAILQALDSKLASLTTSHVQGDLPLGSAASLVEESPPHAAQYRRQWLRLLSDARQQLDAAPLTFSEEGAVRLLEQHLSTLSLQPSAFSIHYANSTAIRLANRYAKGHPVWCNRGTNGIEGTLSTAVGFAAATSNQKSQISNLRSALPLGSSKKSQITFCIIGDLSFFYDQNALWNTFVSHLNLRILLLNNGHGAIFDHLPGLDQSPIADSHVAGRHHTTAEDICLQHSVSRQAATDMQQLQQGIEWLTDTQAEGPRLLEVML